MKPIRNLLLVMVAGCAAPLHAQVPTVPADTASVAALPAAVADDVVRRLNDPTTDLRIGETVLAAGERVDGDLAVLDGELTLFGTVDGDVLVVNGDALLRPGAVVTGGLTVIGGSIEGQGEARIAGEIVTHGEIFAYERVAGRIRHLRGPRPERSPTDRAGYADFLVTTGKSYNRVEGMPIAFGPRLQTESSNPLRLQALAVYRSESGTSLDPERMGYFVRAEQFIAGHREFRVGLTFHSLIDPIEEWQLSDLESGLATFVIHRDYRDHYQRQGWSAFLNWEPPGPLQLLQLEGRWEKHESRTAGSPWSLFRNADPWRAQPLVAEGRLGSVILRGEYDTRIAAWNAANGWLVRGHIEKVVSGGGGYPSVVEAETLAPVSPVLEPDYGRSLSGLIDMRSYNRINADSRLNFRVVAGGSLNRSPLPPQRQHALGGTGSLPGYSLFSADCGARDLLVRRLDSAGAPGSDLFHPHYGCDAFTLVQAEFRGKLSFRFRWDVGPWREGSEDTDRVWDFGWDMAPDWALFVDTGRGWTFHDRPDEEILVNVGAGILLHRIGVYLAVPVSGGSGVNLFVRLGPRF